MKVNELTPGTNIIHTVASGIYPAPLEDRSVTLTRIWVSPDQVFFELEGTYSDGTPFLVGDYNPKAELDSFGYLRLA